MVSKRNEQRINEIQLLEQNLQNFLLQKQTFQAQEAEIDNALLELKDSNGEVFKIAGGLMIKSNKEKLKEELNSKREIIELRVKNIEKQESRLKERINELQGEIMGEIKKNETEK